MNAIETSSPFDAKHLASLDALRVFALTGVVVYHGELVHRIPDGVNLFFVLSGFLFAWLLDREYQQTASVSLRHYYTRRCLRILPACIVSIVFTIAAKSVLHNPVDFRHALSALFFYANYFNAVHDHPPTGFAHYWSLSVEEQFYLLWPVLFLALRRLGRGTAMGCLIGLAVAVLVWRCIALFLLGFSGAYIYNAFETRFDSLAIGCLFGMMVQYPAVKLKITRLCHTGLEPLVPIGLLYGLCFANNHFHKSVGFTLDSIVDGALILSLIQLGQHRYWKWLNHPWLAGLGVLTYSGYLYHTWGLAIGSKIDFLSSGGQVFVGLVASFVLASVSYYFIERPFQKLRHHLIKAQPLSPSLLCSLDEAKTVTCIAESPMNGTLN